MRSLFLALALLASPLFAQPRPYHLELEADPTAPFPYFGKFGTVDLHVYNGGVRADTIWLDGWSRNGTPNITVENPYGRMYTEVPIAQISSIVGKLAGSGGKERGAVGTLEKPMKGKVGSLDATRYRIVYGPAAWIDLWTTSAVPDNPALRSIIHELLRGISPGTARVAQSIPGVPVYVELNFSRFQKLAILKLKKLTFDTTDEADALKTGAIFFKAPLLDALWK